MLLERMEKFQESLQDIGVAAKQHMATVLQKYKDEADRITQEAVDRAIHHEQNKQKLERLQWVSKLMVKYLKDSFWIA